jgi:hypothetical protein
VSAQLFQVPKTPSLDDVLEKTLERQVVQLAQTLGWLRYHTWRSKNSPAGYPDETLVRDRLILLELKREKSRTTEHQRQWLRALQKADVEVYLIRPRNLQALAAVLAARREPDGGHLTTEAARAAETELLAELRKELRP